METYLDVAIVKCPNCRNFFAESSWYAVELESDLDCGKCGKSFNSKQNLIDRILCRFELENGKVKGVSFKQQE